MSGTFGLYTATNQKGFTMFYYATPNQQNGETTIFAMAKTLKEAAAKLARQQMAWPDKYHDGMIVTVCTKSSVSGNMKWHGDYVFTGGKLKLKGKAGFDLDMWGLV